MIPGPNTDDPEVLRLWVRVTNLVLALKDIEASDSVPCDQWQLMNRPCNHCYRCLANNAINSDTELGKQP